MRSAPPLGGLASGTVELRADGTLRAWTIENASPAGSRKFPLPALSGPHQIGNAGLAIAALEKLSEFKVLDSQIVTGLRMVDWPARIQHLTRGPLVDLLPEGWELWLDGGHNAAAGVMLAAVAADWDAQPLHLVFGMLDSKDPATEVSLGGSWQGPH